MGHLQYTLVARDLDHHAGDPPVGLELEAADGDLAVWSTERVTQRPGRTRRAGLAQRTCQVPVPVRQSGSGTCATPVIRRASDS